MMSSISYMIPPHPYIAAYIEPIPNHTQPHSINQLPVNATPGAETREHLPLVLCQSQWNYNDRNPQQL